MKQLSWSQLVSVLDLWSERNVRCFGVLCSTRQFVFAVVTITEATAQSVRIRVDQVVKRLEIAPDAPVTEVELTSANLLAAFQGATADIPVAGIIADHFDDAVQIMTQRMVTSITLYRSSPFRPKTEAG